MRAQRETERDGGLGAGGHSGGAVHTAEPGAAVSAAGEDEGGGVREHADERGLHSRPHHHLLLSHHHLPHRRRRPHLHRIVLFSPMRVVSIGLMFCFDSVPLRLVFCWVFLLDSSQVYLSDEDAMITSALSRFLLFLRPMPEGTLGIFS